MIREFRFAGAMLLSAAFWATAAFTAQAQTQPAADRLPSWKETATKRAIVDFVKKTTTANSPDFVPPAERIATFDNDGTLWCEQPVYVQLEFVVARIHELAPEHPEWKTTEPFASVLKDDRRGLVAAGEKGLLELLTATHFGMTIEEFNQIVTKWIATAKHPTTGRLYTQMAYQPMLELLAYLRAHGYKTYIVSGGGVEFMRPWTERVYGIPPEQVVGSYGQLQFEMENGRPVLRKLPKIGLNDDKAGKPVGIQTFIGRRPVMAFGNSDGDIEMLEWTTSGTGPRFGLIVHHTDAKREYAYDRDSRIGRLDQGLTLAPERGWTVVDMQADWKTIFPDENAPPR
jgi:hypothetical protein